MAIGKFTPPKQWEDWVNLVLGIWLCVSPWVLKFDSDQTVTQYGSRQPRTSAGCITRLHESN